ncbi:MAG: hypothetical protein ACLUP5_01805 [Streptococcus sp.]
MSIISITTMTILMAALTYDGQTVDLSQYEVSLNVDGENGSGVASVHIDATPSVSSSSSEIKKFLENPQITVSKGNWTLRWGHC